MGAVFLWQSIVMNSKKGVVQFYLNGEGGYKYLAKKYGVLSKEQIHTWVEMYKEFGDEGLARSRKNNIYKVLKYFRLKNKIFSNLLIF